MRILMIVLLMGATGAFGICFAQSDTSNEVNGTSKVWPDSKGNIFPDSSSENAEGVYDLNGTTTH